MVGKTLGSRYTILEEISGGGMAVVYKARCNLLNRIVAIKVLKSEYAGDEDFVRRFRREAQAAASLSHSNIVGIYDVGEEGDIYYIVMEYVAGSTLKELIKQRSPIPPVEVIEMGFQICDALECAHKNKIVHRDIKSQNIMITLDGRIKVTDFGIARATGGATITNTGNVFGSVQYFSPEQARSDLVDERSDLYSVGIVLFEAFTGQLPFNGQTPVAIALKQIQEKPELISNIIHGFPKRLEWIVQKCLAKSPNDRYQSAQCLKIDLMDALASEEVKNFKPKNMGDTLVVGKIVDNSQATNPKQTRKKSKNILRMVAISTIFLMLFGVFSYLGANLAKKYFVVPETIVPNVIGLTEEEAKQKIEAKKLKYNVIGRVFDISPAGQVIDQEPKGDRKVKINHPSIDLVISKGPKPGVVPNVIGISEQEGIALLESSGFEPGRIIHENSPDIAEGIIMDQNPRGDLTLSEGERINIVVSLGPELIDAPNLIGKPLDEAKEILKNRNLKYDISQKSDQAPENTVIDQNPSSNETVKPGGTINLVVSSGPADVKQFTVGPILFPPDSSDVTVKIVISDDLGEGRVVYSETHSAEDSPLHVSIEGAGEMEIEVWLDDIPYFKGKR